MSTHSFATTARTDLLRLALVADAAVTGANAVAYLAGAFVLDSVLDVPAELLLALGAFLGVYSGLVLRLATRPSISRGGVIAVIDANLAWAAVSLLVLALDTFTPDTAGQIWIALQAVVVAGFAALQYVGLQRGGGRD
jgi:hypothetical protein